LKPMLLALRLSLSAQVLFSFWTVVMGQGPSAPREASFDEAVRLYVRGESQAAFAELEALEKEGATEEKSAELKKAVMEELALERQGSETIDERDVAEALCQLGQTYAEKGLFGPAEDLFLAAESKMDSYLPACLALAKLYDRKGDSSASVQKWKEAVSLSGDNAAIRFGLARAYAADDDLERAETLFLELMDDNDMAARAGAEAGRILWDRGQQEEAKALWERSIARTPMDGYPFFVIAECCQEQGDRTGAEIGYEKALELGYLPGICRRRLSRLREP